MNFSLFHQESRRIFTGTRDKASPYGHHFGGEEPYRGLVAMEGQPPVHLLFRLNLADPAIGLALPGVTWLPLLCAIRYGACNLGYRVISDDEILILHQTERAAWENFPRENYPERLAPRPLSIEEKPYDPAVPRVALFYAGIFGYDALSPEQFTDLAHYIVAEGIYDEEISDAETPETYLRESCWPYVQGPPDDHCPDPACPNHGRPSSLRTFAIFHESMDWDDDEARKEVRALWGPNCGSLQIIYQTCPLCAAIRTTNQCT